MNGTTNTSMVSREDSRSVDDLVSLGSLDSDEDDDDDAMRTTRALARRENRAVSRVRMAILILLGVTALAVSSFVYWHTTFRQKQSARQDFVRATQQLEKHLWQQWSGPYPSTMQKLAKQLPQEAHWMNQDFPTVSLPQFGPTTDTALELLSLSRLLWLPVVTNQTRKDWENFVPHHASDWIDPQGNDEPLARPPPATITSTTSTSVDRRRRRQLVSSSTEAIRSDIFRADGETATGTGPFFPVWQMNPIVKNVQEVINLDLNSVPVWAQTLAKVMAHNRTHDDKNHNQTLYWGPFLDATSDTPELPLLVPVRSLSAPDEIQAVVVAVASWTTLLFGMGPLPLKITLVNDCQPNVAASFDLQQSKEQAFVEWTDKSQGQDKDPSIILDSGVCPYTLTMHPIAPYTLYHHPNKAMWRTLLTASLFALCAIIFAWYDNLVSRRQQVVLDHAVHSSAIVSSLFPEQVRERLFRRNSTGERSDDDVSGYSRDDSSFVLFEPTKQRLRSFLDQDGHETGGAKPIADLFPHCTVLFADISGFTAWSSLRDPTQVFTLLESVYQTFDKIARKRDVFKVETVGDSYVAVTGLPDPQEEHALIMCRFARDCRARMNEITRSLELTLGPDTAELKMRFGIHSGPVTAGVLRGEKSRFQLFGDTVNTAARMESTGERDKIQLSTTTADLIMVAGKAHWIKPREEKVHAKGKGELQTYWFEPTNSRRSISSVISDDSLTRRTADSQYTENADNDDTIWGENGSNDVDAAYLDYANQKSKHQRLIDYNVDLLAGLLKLVVARRRMVNLTKVSVEEEAPVFSRGSTGLVLDEVVEAIELPEFDPAAHKGFVDPASIELGQTVMAQLKRYVAVIAAMYRNNPFHNFDHASHVTMSVNKLLQRIVTPEFKVRRKSLSMGQEMASDLHHYTYGITSDPLTQLAVVYAALIHDVDHWGVSNQQLVKEGVPVAEKYKNKSVAEQNSVDLAWDLLMDVEEYADLLHCMFATKSEYDRFRQVVVNVVMATDIFDPEMQDMRQKRWNKAFDSNRDNGDNTKNLKATIVIEHIMQASDVAHTMQHWHVYQKWNRRLFDELYTAHKAGRMEKDPSTFWVKGELKFFDSYVIPLAKKLKDCNVFGVSSDECLNYALNNRSEWSSKGDQILKELVANYDLRDKEEKERAKELANSNDANRKRRSRFVRRRSLFTSGG